MGAQGRVYAIDVQEKALQNTRALLEENGLYERVALVQAGHEDLGSLIKGPVDAVVFNLGYLPGGNHTITTRAETTLSALQSAVKLLRHGGRIGLIVYTGHTGGREEYEAVEDWASALDPENYGVIRINFINKGVNSPVVIVIERSGDRIEGQSSAQNY